MKADHYFLIEQYLEDEKKWVMFNPTPLRFWKDAIEQIKNIANDEFYDERFCGGIRIVKINETIHWDTGPGGSSCL